MSGDDGGDVDSVDRGSVVHKSECSLGTPCAFLILLPKKIKGRGKTSVNALIAANSPKPSARPILSVVVEPDIERVDCGYIVSFRIKVSPIGIGEGVSVTGGKLTRLEDIDNDIGLT